MSLFAYLTEDGTYALTSAGYTALVVIMLALLIGACWITKADERNRLSTKRLVFSAMAMALAFVTSFIKFLELPMGGSITLFSMFFIALIGYWYGLSSGLMAAVAYGVLQLVTGPYILSVPQMLCDYIFAFGALGLSGLCSNMRHGLIKGYIVAVIGRFVFAFLSGFIFFGQYAPEGMNPAVYSASYNGIYIFTEAIITIIIIALPPVDAALKRIKNQAVA